MSVGLIAILGLLALVSVVAIAVLFGLVGGGGGAAARSRNSIRTLVAAQRTTVASLSKKGPEIAQEKQDLLKNLQGAKVRRRIDSRLTLRKLLKYAQWRLPPVAFYFFEVVISATAFIIMCNFEVNFIMRLLSLLAGPLFMSWLLNTMVDHRFKRFDADYAQFLMSLVGLLKTGMTAMGALENAAQGLSESSLVRQECELMVERLRFGVPEDKSIGAFGEDIYHPEIELFVQALLLNRRVGGTLSDTLERLAKQVRKRQFFRNSAIAAVSMQRGSIWIIIALLCGIELYLYMMYPILVTEALNSEQGWQVWQFGIVMILLGIFWVRQVTKIRV